MEMVQETLKQGVEFVTAHPLIAAGVAAGGVVLLMLLSLLRRWRRPGRSQRPETEVHLAKLPPPPAQFADGPRLSCHGVDVRLRVVVAAPLGLDSGVVVRADILPLLEAAMPGLGNQAVVDAPLLQAWATQFSYEGFVAAVRRSLVLPDPDEPLSPWILLAGKVIRGKRPFALGLALLGAQPNTLGPVRLDHPHQWMEVLRLSR
ncbi:MAG TPA: hypothetical protein PKD86_09470 [Gemmatales bacterium]|nr:hypothetical protein [Gemmatales bacterium]HMP59569.1 hypothetical protein [Gemmatales bacterium]